MPDVVFEEHELQSKALIGSLSQSWKKAQNRFKEETGEALGDYKSTKDGILGMLRQKYGSDSKETQKRDRILDTLGFVLNGVELVAATTVQVASQIFAPAQMCFNAFSILLSIPRALQKFHEDLQLLFNDVSGYLKKFHIYDRIDRRGALDAELIISNNAILINLVELCMLAYKVMKTPKKTILGNAFLKNDAITAALSGFRDLIDQQNQLTSIVTLDSVLKSEVLSQQILQRTTRMEENTKDTKTIVMGIAAENAETRNTKIDQDRVLRIEKRLELTEIAVNKPLEQLRSVRAPPLEGTIGILRGDTNFKEWRNGAARWRALYVSGNTETGKTYLLRAVAQDIDEEGRKLQAQNQDDAKGLKNMAERNCYLTYYSFSLAGSAKDRGKFDTPAHMALKIMAAQLARQNKRYARILIDGMDEVQKGQKTLRELWQALKMNSGTALANSVLYMFFDGADQLKSSLSELSKVLKTPTSQETSENEGEAPIVRLILTGKPETSEKLAMKQVHTINVSDINESLIRTYVEQGLQSSDVFQDNDEDSQRCKKKVLNTIVTESRGNFGVAAQKIKVVEEAIEKDMDFEDLVHDLQRATLNTKADEGRKVLTRLVAGMRLSVEHRQQLRELLIWAVYAKRSPDLSELEAALYLRHNKKSLAPLKQKIESRFEDVLEIVGRIVYPRDYVEEAIENYTPASDADAVEDPQIRNNVTVKASDDLLLRQLVSDLSDRILDVKSKISSSTEQINETERLVFSQGEAEFTIVTRLLRALTDDRVYRYAEPLIRYATSFLPSHLNSFRTHSLGSASLDDLGLVGRALVNFLWDPESISAAWNVHPFDSYEWFNQSNVDDIGAILTHDRVINQLDPMQRRWVYQNTSKNAGNVSLLSIMARKTAQKWLEDCSYKVHATDCFLFIDRYLNLLPRSDFSALKQIEESSTHEQEQIIDKSHVEGPDTVLDNRALTGDLVDKATQGSSEEQQSDQTNGDASMNDTGLPILRRADTDILGVVDVDESLLMLDSDKAVPLTGNFSMKSRDIKLLERSILSAQCENLKGHLCPTSIDLNDCLANNWGRPQWRQGGDLFRTARKAQLSQGGKVLEVVLRDAREHWRRHSVRLDEQIAVDDGRLIFLNNTTEEELPFLERLKRAESWAIKILGNQMGSLALTRLGYTLLDDEPKLAIEYLDRAKPESQNPWKFVGLSVAYERQGKYNSALRSLQDALPFFRAKHDFKNARDTPKGETIGNENDFEVTDLFTCLSRIAYYQSILKDDTAAIETLEATLTHRPSSGICRLKLMKLLCKTNNYTRAEELFDSWEEVAKKLGAKSPSSYLNMLSQQDHFYEHFWPLVVAKKSPKLYNSIQVLFEKAVEEARRQQRDADRIKLLYGRAALLAFGEDSDNVHGARQSWTEGFAVGRALRNDSELEYYEEEALVYCSTLAGLSYFEQAREKLKLLTNNANLEKVNVIDKLEVEIRKLTGPDLRMWNKSIVPTRFTASLAVLAGELDRAREILRADMVEALEILSDDDMYNDDVGLSLLADVLIHYGDIEGALSAWSFFDRVVNRPRVRQRIRQKFRLKFIQAAFARRLHDQTAKFAGQSQRNDGIDQDPSSCHDETQDAALKDKPEHLAMSPNNSIIKQEAEAISDARAGSEPKSQPEELDTVDRYLILSCDFCSSPLWSWQHEQWWCRYCPDIAFCTPCKELLKQRHMTRYVCNPDHELVLFKHPEYSREELRGTNVRVGWKWRDVRQEDGSMIRERVGGEIVQLHQWLEMLRQEWGI